jgi:hypothetical protein
MSWIQNSIARAFGLPTLDDIVTYVNEQLNGTTNFESQTTTKYKLDKIFSNPATLKVFALQCDLFSLGKVYVYKGEENLGNDPFLEMLKNPNPFQRQSQFLWDYMFWNMIGNSYNYCDSKIVSEDNLLYFLAADKMEFTPEMDSYKDKLVFAKETVKKIGDLTFKYIYSDGSNTNIAWRKIIHIPDLTNGTGNWFAGQSRIDALYKIITNSEEALNAKNINLRFSGKFMVAGKADPDNISQLPMADTEKSDIERKMNGRKNVHAVKSMIDIKRFVENIGALKLDESYLNDYYTIGSMYGIPKDVLEAYNSSTFENQEKARGAHVSYCLQPKGNLFFEAHADYFGYSKQGKSIIIDWEHLPFMQVFAKDRAETNKITSETILNLMKAGIKLDEINKILDLELTELDYERAERQNQSRINQSNSAN